VSRLGEVTGRADFTWEGTQRARLDVNTGAPGIVVVKNAYDRNWHATVDGSSAPVLRADYWLQGIPVPGGVHDVVLVYDDPWIGYGLLGTAVSLTVLLGASAWSHANERGRDAPRLPPAV
jgi:uncharacterized membrane protein YfhO